MSLNQTEENKINELVSKACKGDDKAMSELIALVTPSAKAKAARLNSGNSRVSNEDLVQEGMFGFLEAVKKFDPSKGISFISFASVCIEHRIISALRETSNSGNAALSYAVPFDEFLQLDTTDPTAMVDSSVTAADLLRKAEKLLSEKEMQVLKLRVEGSSYADIARLLGCTEKSIDNATQRIRKKLSPSVFRK